MLQRKIKFPACVDYFISYFKTHHIHIRKITLNVTVVEYLDFRCPKS